MITVPMTLRHNSTGAEVVPGDQVTSFRGEVATVSDPVGRSPHHSSSTGRIFVVDGDREDSFFPSVFDCKWHYDAPEEAAVMGLHIPEGNIPR